MFRPERVSYRKRFSLKMTKAHILISVCGCEDMWQMCLCRLCESVSEAVCMHACMRVSVYVQECVCVGGLCTVCPVSG